MKRIRRYDRVIVTREATYYVEDDYNDQDIDSIIALNSTDRVQLDDIRYLEETEEPIDGDTIEIEGNDGYTKEV